MSPSPRTSMVDEPEPEPEPTAHQVSTLERLKVSLLLENSGSVARDHLASERTFLAYVRQPTRAPFPPNLHLHQVRTSLVLASTGVGASKSLSLLSLVQLFTIASNTQTNDNFNFSPNTRRFQTWARPLGATMVGFGLVVLALGTNRYFAIQSGLTKGLFPVARLTTALITLVLGTVIVVIFGILVSARA
ncbi:hypothetical protein FB45DRAFT_870002 [Roridomyces roridus]|uniref:DUF202 domain-containing protein n=1 Tax=Roridomyces roridus TaxID=1738132 RepID=A0AAD7BK29_9AGAR|nr:hypothetical protein FB45DRAFT_870002 [Roridomyces roridus]